MGPRKVAAPVLFVTLWLYLAGFVAIRDCPWLCLELGRGQKMAVPFLIIPGPLALSLTELVQPLAPGRTQFLPLQTSCPGWYFQGLPFRETRPWLLTVW